MSPLFTAIFSYFILKKGLTKLKVAVLVVSFIGVVVMLTGKLELTFQLFDPDPDIMENDTDEDKDETLSEQI